jgi:membrane protein DedA with SNARE-associated domain
MNATFFLPRPRLLFLAVFIWLLLTFHVQDFFAKAILVFAPHPDDEALMAAGIITTALTNGDNVKVVVMTNGNVNGASVGYTREGESVRIPNATAD